jgi:hypothetical protein
MSNPTPIHRGMIEKGVLTLAEPQTFIGYLHTLKGEVEIIIRSPRKKRSNDQNEYYWGVVLKLIADQTGHTDEEVHEHLKWRFLRKHGRLETVKSTTKLSTIEFEEYLSKVRQFASGELNIYVPLPNEVSEEDKETLNKQGYA